MQVKASVVVVSTGQEAETITVAYFQGDGGTVASGSLTMTFTDTSLFGKYKVGDEVTLEVAPCLPG